MQVKFKKLVDFYITSTLIKLREGYSFMRKFIIISKIALLLSLTMGSNLLFASERAISIGGGYSFSSIIGEQDILHKYNDSSSLVTVKDRPVNSYSNRFNNLSFEYQVRFEKLIIGTSLNLTSPIYEGNLKEDEFTKSGNIKIITNNVDISLVALYNIASINNFKLYGGGSIGIGFMHIAQNSTHFVLIDSTHNNQMYIAPKLILDGEYNISKHFAIFSRISFMPKLIGKDIVYQVSPQYNKDNNSTITNTLTVENISTADVNFGIRFKF